MDIDELLKDATLAANAAVRLGKPAGADLCRKIAAVKNGPQTWENPHILPLQESFSETLAAISPITLNDLHAGFLPYGPRTNLTKFGIALLALLAFSLLYLTAALSFWQTSAAVVVANSKDEKFATRERLLTDALPLLIKLEELDASSEDKTDPNSVLRASLRTQMKEISLLSQQIVSDANALEMMNRNFTVGCLLLPFSKRLCPTTAPMQAVVGVALPEAGEVAKAAGMTGAAFGKPADPAGTGTAKAEPADTGAPTVATNIAPCDPNGIAKVQTGLQGARGFDQVARTEDTLLWQARCALGIAAIEASAVGAPSFGTASDLARRVTLFSAWLLPALYGALGSVVFHLRRLLDPTLPNPDGWRIFLRICLSAFAGISLSWFWRPDDGGNFSIASISVGSATMAFLIGYSIDAFFKLLDRIVFVANAQIDKMGGSEKAPA